MAIKQRQIVEVAFRIPPDGKPMTHPCVVLSNEDINEVEEAFVAVMLTSDKRFKDDEYSFELDNSMLTKPHNLNFCAARIHLIGHFMYRDIVKNSHWGTEMRVDSFQRMMTTINRTTFNMRYQLVASK